MLLQRSACLCIPVLGLKRVPPHPALTYLFLNLRSTTGHIGYSQFILKYLKSFSYCSIYNIISKYLCMVPQQKKLQTRSVPKHMHKNGWLLLYWFHVYSSIVCLLKQVNNMYACTRSSFLICPKLTDCLHS